MKTKDHYRGIIPAMYACYHENGTVSKEKTQKMTRHLMQKGVKGAYIGGSSGECIYQSVAERKLVLESVMAEKEEGFTVIAHVACNNTKDSVELAQHAQECGVDAIACIPPIYFHLPEYAIAQYWNTISEAAPDTDFVIYNIPQLAGVATTMSLFREMLKNPRVVGLKSSSLFVLDIQQFKTVGGPDFIVFNGVDEQYLAGRAMGADGGIGGTYAVMPELFLKLDELISDGLFLEAQKLQLVINQIISEALSCHGNMYAVMKEILRRRENLDIGTVRAPLPDLVQDDLPRVEACCRMITEAIERYR